MISTHLNRSETTQECYFIAVIENIELQKQAQESQHRLNEQLEEMVQVRTHQLHESLAELSLLAFTLAHDLRAPTRHIAAFAQSALECTQEGHVEETKKLIQKIRQAADKQIRLIDGIIVYIHHSERSLTLQPIDFEEVAREQASLLLMKEPASRRINLRIDPLPRAIGDKEAIAEMFNQLLSNALRFTVHSPEAEIHVGCTTKDGTTVYFTKDNGIGFDGAAATALFGLFQRFHSQSEFSGRGIGLAIAKRLVARLEGEIWAESSPRQGATFYFTINVKGDKSEPGASLDR